MNPCVTAWMAATGETTLDGAGYKYVIWISCKWAEWKRLQNQNRNPSDPTLESDHAAFDAWLTGKDGAP